MATIVVSDTGPLISLEKISNGFNLIRKLEYKILIPPKVLEEVSEGFIPKERYVQHFAIEDIVEIVKMASTPLIQHNERLHEGERQAITLAKSLDVPLLIEEKFGREVAKVIGLKFYGIAGLILKANKQKTITLHEAKSCFYQLAEAGRISRKLFLELENELK
ncbi:MAG: hypothetical protein KGZ58_11930 [Ignavibacteriales bacterium]|nr:hypothetical protein [Ignavibacteriales bacterium]